MCCSLDDADEDGEDSAFGSELLADIIDDLNVVVNHAIEHQFGKLDSGDEAEADDMETGECVSDEEVEIYCVSDGIGDDPVATKDEITAEALFAENFLDSFGDEDEDLAENLKNAVLCETSANGWEDVVEPDTIEYMHGPYDPVNNTSSYPSLRQGYSGPTADVLRRGDSPIGLFFYFLPVVLWQHIAACSTEYHREMLPRRLGETFQRYRRKRRLNPQLPRKTRRDIQHKLEGMKPVLPHEMCQFVELLVARTVVPNREKLANQWKTTAEGAMSRVAQTDRAWKIRKLVEVLQRTLLRGYVAPSHLAFDEAVLPSRSSFNKMRVYMKDKPHKWGTKLFMLCSAVSAYCIRFEVYCGQKQHASDAHKPYMKSGPAAVVRNLLAAFGPDARKQGMRLVVIDRFYTSVALAIQLLLLGFNCVGTVMTNRWGYLEGVVEKTKTRPPMITRGSFKVVLLSSTGGSLELDRVVQQNGPTQEEVPCPRVVKDYHAYMGGVDVHDELRSQRFSLQRALRFRKYYKSLALGLIDLTIVSGYIVHKAFHKNKQSRLLTHAKYMKKLHIQLCRLQATDMYESNTFGTQPPQAMPAYVPVPVGVTQSTATLPVK
ncbi:hypothetical protein L916_14868 [Phytophthora nicotianae]|uniref:PiggyBac transposable element-derived protein domain-containing protein n=1 Tax=Phytophthora nicotianae TaxID=4792 RepID=W2IE87_PHYNI|nr:hypothetical protein L916_14868 [Phytophthora nicotianae]